MLRRVGTFGWWPVAVYPAPLAGFLALFARSLVLTGGRGEVPWKGRMVSTRPATRAQDSPLGCPQAATGRRASRTSDLGVPMLPPVSARCIAGARALYSGILDRIEARAYDVFSARVRVPTWQKMEVAARVARPRHSPVIQRRSGNVAVP
jgi:hypothetical protein